MKQISCTIRSAFFAFAFIGGNCQSSHVDDGCAKDAACAKKGRAMLQTKSFKTLETMTTHHHSQLKLSESKTNDYIYTLVYTDERCHPTHWSEPREWGNLGVGLTVQQCQDRCTASGECKWVTFKNGQCTAYTACDTTQTNTGSIGHRTWRKDEVTPAAPTPAPTPTEGDVAEEPTTSPTAATLPTPIPTSTPITGTVSYKLTLTNARCHPRLRNNLAKWGDLGLGLSNEDCQAACSAMLECMFVVKDGNDRCTSFHACDLTEDRDGYTTWEKESSGEITEDPTVSPTIPPSPPPVSSPTSDQPPTPWPTPSPWRPVCWRNACDAITVPWRKKCQAFSYCWCRDPCDSFAYDWEEECAANDSPRGKPNILVMTADDLAANGGGPDAKQPHLDNLASKGVRFARAYANHPVCAPSRASMMTGIRGGESGYYFGRRGVNTGPMDMKVLWYDNRILKNSMTMMEFFRSKCYLVLGTGKVNHDELGDTAVGPWPATGQWDLYYAKTDYGPQAHDGLSSGDWGVAHPSMPQTLRDAFPGPLDFNFARLSDTPFPDTGGYRYLNQPGTVPIGNGWFVYNSRTDRSRLPDEYNADWAIESLGRLNQLATGQPWMLMLGFTKPHTPLYCPDEYFDEFPLEDIRLPDNIEDANPGAFLDDVSDPDEDKGFVHYDFLSRSFDSPRDAFKKWYQAYYACVKLLDDQVGKVVDYLATTSFWDNTIIVFTSDNGWQNGPKKFIFKNAPWEDSTHVPLVIRAPGVQNEGLVSDAPVTLVDIYPTLLDLCGFSGHQTTKNDNGRPLSGTSMKPLLQGGSWSGPDVAISQIYPTDNIISLPWPNCNHDLTCNHWSVRSRDYRYILYNNGMEELYDHRVDSNEETNVASRNEYGTAKEALKNELLKMPGMEEDQEMLGAWAPATQRLWVNSSAFVSKPTCTEFPCLKIPEDWSVKCNWPECSMHESCIEPGQRNRCLLDFTTIGPTTEYTEAVRQYSLSIDSDPHNDRDW